MRPTKDGSLLPVTCEVDIDALAPLPLGTLPSRRPRTLQSRPIAPGSCTAGHINVNGLFPSHFALLEDKVAESRFYAIVISEAKINPHAIVYIHCSCHLRKAPQASPAANSH